VVQSKVLQISFSNKELYMVETVNKTAEMSSSTDLKTFHSIPWHLESEATIVNTGYYVLKIVLELGVPLL
jgi:hypothetical protein